jgi:hypothetical protein
MAVTNRYMAIANAFKKRKERSSGRNHAAVSPSKASMWRQAARSFNTARRSLQPAYTSPVILGN